MGRNIRNTKKEKIKRNRKFPYKSRISRCVNQTERYAVVYSKTKEVVVEGGVTHTYRLKQSAINVKRILQTKLRDDLEIIDFQKKE